MATQKTIKGITKEEWFEFEALRRSGRTNMWGASRLLGFDCTPIMNEKAYTEMETAWVEEFENDQREQNKDFEAWRQST